MDRRILYVDPDREALEQFQDVIAGIDGLSVTVTEEMDVAEDILEDNEFDAVIAAPSLGYDEIRSLFEQVQQAPRPVPCIILAAGDMSALLENRQLMLHTSAVHTKDRDDAYTKMADEVKEALRDRSEIEYPVPDNEEERLKAVERLHIDRLREEEAFDWLTELAKEFFGMKYAFAGIITEDTEEFIARIGDDAERLPRAATISTFGILDGETTVVENRHEDERFKYITELDKLDIVFFAGHPLTSSEGYRIGMFAVMDDKPRSFSADDRERLKQFADEASELIRRYEEET